MRKSNNRATRKRKPNGGAEQLNTDKSVFLYLSKQISTQPNTDTSYSEIGIIHMTESAAINAIRATATGFLNIFGKKGIDNTIYDKARNLALNKLMEQVTPNQKICNLRIDVVDEGASKLFFIHLYGTLLEKIEQIN